MTTAQRDVSIPYLLAHDYQSAKKPTIYYVGLQSIPQHSPPQKTPQIFLGSCQRKINKLKRRKTFGSGIYGQMKQIWEAVMRPERPDVPRLPNSSKPLRSRSLSFAFEDLGSRPQTSRERQTIKPRLAPREKEVIVPLTSRETSTQGEATASKARLLTYKDHADIVDAQIRLLRDAAKNKLKNLKLSEEQYLRQQKSNWRRELRRIHMEHDRAVAAEKKSVERQRCELSEMKRLLAEEESVQLDLEESEQEYQKKLKLEENVHEELSERHQELSAELDRLDRTNSELDMWKSKIKEYEDSVDDMLSHQMKLLTRVEAVDEEIRFAESLECNSHRLQLLNRVRKARIADVARPEHITEQAIMVPVQEVRPGFVNWRESCTELVGRLSTIVAHAHASYDTLHQALTCPLCKHPLDQGPFMYV